MKKLTIWHTNDVHSRFEGFAAHAAYVRKNADPENDLFLDAGDFADRLSVMVSGTAGLGAMRLLKAAGADAIAVGNNEFFAGAEDLSLMASCGVPMLAANLRALDGSEIPGIKPYIYMRRAGLRLLVIGSCPFFTHVSFFTDNAGVRLLDPVEVLQKIIEEQRGNFDLCILLSHTGIRRDLEIAEKVPGIDVIIGGHSHTLMESSEEHFGKIIHQSGCHAAALGKLELFIEDGRIAGHRGVNLKPLEEPAADLLAILAEEEEKGARELSKPLFTMSRSLDYDPFGECPACNAVADSLRLLYGGDLALINNGIICSGFSGEVSRMSLLKASPSILNPTTVWWKGRDIRKALEASMDPGFIRQDGKGPGFRGEVLGSLSVSRNVRIRPGERLGVLIDGVPLEDERTYCVIADDYMYRGIAGYTMLKGSERPEVYHPGYIRDMLEHTLCLEEIVSGAFERRCIL